MRVLSATIAMMCFFFSCNIIPRVEQVLGDYEVTVLTYSSLIDVDTTTAVISVSASDRDKIRLGGTYYHDYEFSMEEDGSFSLGGGSIRPHIWGRVYEDSITVFGHTGRGGGPPLPTYFGRRQ